MYNTKGIALLLSLIIMVILLVLGGAYMYMVRLEAYISKNQRDSTEALYIAEAGMERGIRNFVELKGSWPTGTTLGPEYLDTANTKKYTVTSEDSPLGADWRRLKSTGIVLEPGTGVELAKRILQADVSIVAFKYALLSNEDINRSTAYGTIAGKIHANRMVYLNPAKMEMTTAGQPEASTPRVLMPQINMSYDSAGNPSPTNFYANSDNFVGTGLAHNDIVGDTSFGITLPLYTSSVYYIRGIAYIYTVDQNVTFTDCVLVAEGRTATVGIDTSIPPPPWTTLTTSDTISDFSTTNRWATVNGDLFSYAGISGNDFTGCDGPATATVHYAGETVAQVNASQTATAVTLSPLTTTLTLQSLWSASGFLYPAGSAFIEGDSFTYTDINRTTNTLQGCQGFDSDHPTGVYVIQPQDGIVIKGREIICSGGVGFIPPGKTKIKFDMKNVTLYNTELDSFSATWIDPTVLNQIWIGGQKVWDGSYNSGGGKVSFNQSPNFYILNVGSNVEVKFIFSGNMSVSGAAQLIATFYEKTYNTPYEIKLSITGVKILNFTVPTFGTPPKAKYPAMATKLGNVREFGSEVKGNRVVKGVAYSEQGRVQFDHVDMQGCIVANEIDLINKNGEVTTAKEINIDNTSPVDKYVPAPAPEGFTGGLTIVNWREVY